QSSGKQSQLTWVQNSEGAGPGDWKSSTADASAHIARRPGGRRRRELIASKKPHPSPYPANSTASPQHEPDAMGGAGLATGALWRPAQCLFRGAARPPARTRQGKGSVMAPRATTGTP